jgi:acyl-CoA synthetase (AMP-forming)/AMP-acid ligase II
MLSYIHITGKLLSRSQKIAYTLLNKAFSKGGETCLKSGDRIALVYPNSDPINFICAFYGCLQAGIVPVPIEVPLTRRVRISHLHYIYLAKVVCLL